MHHHLFLVEQTVCFFHSAQRCSVTTLVFNPSSPYNLMNANQGKYVPRKLSKFIITNISFVSECCYATRKEKNTKKKQLYQKIIIFWSVPTSLGLLVFIQSKAAQCIMHFDCGFSSHFKWAFFSPE